MKQYIPFFLSLFVIIACKKEESQDFDTDLEVVTYPDTMGYYNGTWQSTHNYYSDFMDDSEPPSYATFNYDGVLKVQLVQLEANRYEIIPVEGSPETYFREFSLNDSLSFYTEEHSIGSGFSFSGHFENEERTNFFFRTFRGSFDTDGLSYENSEDKTTTYSVVKE